MHSATFNQASHQASFAQPRISPRPHSPAGLLQAVTRLGLLSFASLVFGLSLALPLGSNQLYSLPFRIWLLILNSIVLTTPALFLGLGLSRAELHRSQVWASLLDALAAASWVLLGLSPALAFVLVTGDHQSLSSMLFGAPVLFVAAMLFVRRMGALLHQATHPSLGSKSPEEANIDTPPGELRRPGLPPLETRLVEKRWAPYLVFWLWQAAFLGLGLIDYVGIFKEIF